MTDKRLKLGSATTEWLENRLCGIGSHLRKLGVSHENRRNLGIALTPFINNAGLNKARIYARFWNQDNPRKLTRNKETL